MCGKAPARHTQVSVNKDLSQKPLVRLGRTGPTRMMREISGRLKDLARRLK